MNQTRPRLILARDGFPYLGGSSTLIYLLFEALQKKLPNTECWNIISPRVWEIGKRHYGPQWPNPRSLPNVHTFVLDKAKGERNIRRALKAKPVFAVLSKSRKTTPLLKRLVPSIPVWHFTSTCSIVKNAVAGGKFPSTEHVIRSLESGRFPKLRCDDEQHAVQLADRILCHTQRMKFWYHTFYPQVREKIEEEVFWDYPVIKRELHAMDTNTPWQKRPIDLLFVATDWRRGEKNFKLLEQLCRGFHRKKIMVVGFLPKRLPDSVIVFDTMSQKDVVQAMGQAKVLVCPSRYDEAPNVLFEAAIAGSNIVCSKNCGNYRLADERLVTKLKLADFSEKIKLALQRYYVPNMGVFEKNDVCNWIAKELLKAK